MREGIGTNNGLVRLYRHVAQLADQLAGTMNFLMFDVGVHTNQILTGFQDHRDFFQRGITGTLTDTVDSTFDLTGAHLYGTNGVGNR